MTTQADKNTLNGTLAELYAKHERLLDEPQKVDLDIATTERTLSILGAEDGDRHDSVIPADIANCETRCAALYEIAKLNEGIVGIVRTTAAGYLVIAAGLTDAKRASVIATIHRFHEPQRPLGMDRTGFPPPQGVRSTTTPDGCTFASSPSHHRGWV